MSACNPLVQFNGHLLSGDATYRSAGISVYIANLLTQFGTGDYGVRMQVYLGRGVQIDGGGIPVMHSRIATRRPWARILWEQTALPWALRKSGADVLHAPAFVAPLAAGCPSVVTAHDLSFLRYPEMFRAGNRLYLRTFTGPSCRRAAAVIALSAFAAQEITRLLGVPAERIVVVHPGVAPRFHPIDEATVSEFRRRKQLPERFVLFLGTLEPRKNLIRLIRAYALLRDPEVHLVLAGAQGWFYQDILREVDSAGLAGRVHFPGFVASEEQALWYNAADVFAYLSVYEGFGMPVLEALACGTPTVTSSTSSLPEAGGEAAVLVHPDDEQAIATAIREMLSDAKLRAHLRQRGPDHAAGFPWTSAARKTAEVYRRVAQGRAIP